MRNVQSLTENGGPVYVFTNENVTEYLSGLNLSGADVLTVASSGDHLLEAYQMGAKSVDSFDANVFQQGVVDLKIAMLKNLPYETFVKFFLCYETLFDYKLIEPIKNRLSNATNNLLNLHKCMGNSIIRFKPALNKKYVKKVSYLRTQENYYQLRDKLPDTINFAHVDLKNLVNKFHKQYDVILLSNIVEYLYPDTSLTVNQLTIKMYDELLKQMGNVLLKPNGIIVYDYFWNFSEDAKSYKKQQLDNVSVCQYAGPKYKFSTVNIPSVCYNTKYEDLVCLMQKCGR